MPCEPWHPASRIAEQLMLCQSEQITYVSGSGEVKPRNVQQ